MKKMMRKLCYGGLVISIITPNFVAFANNDEENNEPATVLQTEEEMTSDTIDSGESFTEIEMLSENGPTVYLDTLSVDKKVVKPGDVVNISLKVTGDFTSSSDISIGYDKPISDGYILPYLYYNEVTQCFEGRIEINETFEAGEYLISTININDIHGNPPVSYLPEYNDNYLLQGSFTVVGTEDTADYTAPIIHSDTIQINRDKSSIKVSVSIEDNLSGVHYAGVMYQRPISQLTEWIDLSYNSATDRYEGVLNLGNFPEVGEWKMTFIDAEDAQGNQSRVAEGLEQGNFIITEGTTEDNVAPTIYPETFWMDKTIVVKGDSVKISIKAEDAGSGIKEIYAIWNRFFGAKLEYNEETQCYEGVFDTSEIDFSGVSSIHISAWDYWGNDSWIDNVGTLFILDTGESGWFSKYEFPITWYYVKENGVLATGWEKVNGTWYYFNSSGEMQTGWLREGNTWYYLKSSGAMATGWEKVNGTWYYFKSSGTMQTGWLREGNTWYYLKSSGAMATGWEKVNGTWYYFYSSGKMATSGVIDGWKITSSGAAYKM